MCQRVTGYLLMDPGITRKPWAERQEKMWLQVVHTDGYGSVAGTVLVSNWIQVQKIKEKSYVQKIFLFNAGQLVGEGMAMNNREKERVVSQYDGGDDEARPEMVWSNVGGFHSVCLYNTWRFTINHIARNY